MKKLIYLLLLIIFIQSIILVILLNNDSQIQKIQIFERFNKKDTMDIIRELLVHEKKLNRIAWNSSKTLSIITYPFLDDNYENELIRDNVTFTAGVNICPQVGFLNILRFKINPDSSAHIEYSYGTNLGGAIFLKKNKKWETERFYHQKR